MLAKHHLWQLATFIAFAALAVYVALEPIMGADDCISLGEILILLPYYALLYFGTLPALIAAVVWRIVKGRTMASQRRTDLILAIGVLAVLLILEVVAYLPSPYLTLANRCLDFMPSAVLALWVARIWLCARVPQGARV